MSVPPFSDSGSVRDRADPMTADREQVAPAERTLSPRPASPTAEYVSAGPLETASLLPSVRVAAPATASVQLPGYEILGELGRGGMGVVYKARQFGLNRLVALKMILAGGHASAGELDRFRTEAEAVARLQHPNVVTIHEVGEQNGLPYYSLEYCEGGSLSALLDGTPWEPNRAAALVETLARAMHAAHTVGVVHRDLKPANVLLAADRTPKISDFGLAKRLDRVTGRTATGAILGTPSYMAPEQAAGSKEIGPTADVYALGAILYELLTGRPPFRAATPLETVLQVVGDEPVPPTRMQPKTPLDLETICLKCLAKEPSRRYPAADALAADLRRFRVGEPIAARPVGRLERGWRWCRRNPVLAGALTAAVLALLTGSLTSAAFGVRASRVADQVRGEALRADRESAIAVANADQARAQTRFAQRLLYAARMNLIQAAWEANEAVRVLDLLRATAPQPGDEDFRGFEWHYWDRLCRGHVVTLAGSAQDVRQAQAAYRPSQEVRQVAFRPDGRQLAGASDDGTIRVWDATTGQELLAWNGHGSGAKCLAYSPDGRHLVSGGKDVTDVANVRVYYGAVRVWDVATGRQALAWKADNAEVNSVAYSPDGRNIVSGGGTEVMVWDADTGRAVRTLSRRGGQTTDVAYSPDGRWVAGAGVAGPRFEGTVDVWAAADGTPLHTLHAGPSAVESVSFDRDGRRLVTSVWDGSPRVWEVSTGRELLTLRAERKELLATWGRLAFGARGRLVGAGPDGAFRVWDDGTGRELLTIPGAGFLAVSPDGTRVAGRSADGMLKLWDAATGLEPLTLRGHAGPVGCVAFSPNGRTIVSGARDKTVRLWDAAGGLPPRVIGRHAGTEWSNVTAVVFSPDGRRVTSGGGDGTLRVWDVETGTAIFTIHDVPQPVTGIAYSPDGLRLSCGNNMRSRASFGSVVKVWNAADGREVLELIGLRQFATCVAYSPDGQRLACGCTDPTVLVWDLNGDGPAARLSGHSDKVVHVAFSPDGRRLASASEDNTIRVWDLETGRTVIAANCHKSRLTGAALSPDGQRLATASLDGTVKVWDTVTGQELLSLLAPGWVSSVAFSPDGRRLACGTEDGANDDGRPRSEKPGVITVWGAFEHERSPAADGAK
jgi:WD40 repeat protein